LAPAMVVALGTIVHDFYIADDNVDLDDADGASVQLSPCVQNVYYISD
jgi:hypothetical protein